MTMPGSSPPVAASGPLSEDSLFALVMASAPAAVAIYDTRGRRLRANAKADALLGSGAAPVAERLVREVLAGAHDAFSDEVGASGNQDVRLSWHCHPIRDDQRQLAGALLIVDDVSRIARLEALAMTDPLTRVPNHGAFRKRLGAEVELASRQGTPLALALIDVDGFKAVNDTSGHQVGDRILIDVVAIISEHVRASDVLGRVGGDEFALLMPHTDVGGAAVIAERAHAEVGATSFAEGHRVTLSIGLCELDEGEAPEGLVARADRALYASKAHGRDMIWHYDAEHDALQDALNVDAAGQLARSQCVAAIRTLARAIDLKDPATRQHSDRVAGLAVRLAEILGWPPERRDLLHDVAVVHDIGKIAVPERILLKADRLTDDEYAIVRTHAELGAQIAAEILTPEQTGWLRSHHERFDGTGYPDGLDDDDIPDGARLLAATDAYDVMVSDHPYAAGRDPIDALDELRRCAGTQFAPDVVEAFHTRQFVRLATIHSNQERSRAANRDPAIATDQRLDLRCECGYSWCTTHVAIGPGELRAARSHQRRFVLADGHEIPEVERVVGRTPRFVVAEKRI
jgi:diguanylate cyclase (GGDEF)-like protein